MSDDNRLFDRRSSLKLLSVGAAGASFLTAGSALAESGEATSAVWDHETDVLCVGAGAAGLAAAVSATMKGCSVSVVEKMPVIGGTSRRSGGIVWVPNNRFMKSAGITDKKEDCIRYMARCAFPTLFSQDHSFFGLKESAYRKLETYYDRCQEMATVFESAEAIKFKAFMMWGEGVFSPDYADTLQTADSKRGRAVETAPFGDSGASISQSGANLILHMEKWLKANNTRFFVRHRVNSIIFENGRAIGLTVEAGTKEKPVLLRFKARKGIVFGSGGFAHNIDLLAQQRFPIFGACAAGSSTGDFVPMATKAGAKAFALDTAWRAQVMLEDAIRNRQIPWSVFVLPGDSMVMVNRYGKRACNESENYNDRTAAHFVYDAAKREYPNSFLVWIFDQRCLERFGGAYPIPKTAGENPAIMQAGSIKELGKVLRDRLKSVGAAGKLPLDLADDFESQLEATIRRYNSYAKDGNDPEFGRGEGEFDRVWNRAYSAMRDGETTFDNPYPNKCMHPLSKGPYFATILVPGALDTCAGPETNEKAQVLDTQDRPIPGLYAAGNCAASIGHDAYFGAGATLGQALTFGYVAGQTIAQS